MAISNCRSVYYLKRSFYLYVQRTSSLVHTGNDMVLDYNVNAINSLETNIANDYNAELEAIIILEGLCSWSQIGAFRLGRRSWIKGIKRFVENYPRFWKNSYYSLYPFSVRTIAWLSRHYCYFTMRFLSKTKTFFHR